MKILFMFTMTIFSLNAMSADPMPKDPIKLPNKYKIMEKNEVDKIKISFGVMVSQKKKRNQNGKKNKKFVLNS